MQDPSTFLATRSRRNWENWPVLEMLHFPVNPFFSFPHTEEPLFSTFLFVCLCIQVFCLGGIVYLFFWAFCSTFLVAFVFCFPWVLSLGMLTVEYHPVQVPALPASAISLISFHRRVENQETDSGLILGWQIHPVSSEKGALFPSFLDSEENYPRIME